MGGQSGREGLQLPSGDTRRSVRVWALLALALCCISILPASGREHTSTKTAASIAGQATPRAKNQGIISKMIVDATAEKDGGIQVREAVTVENYPQSNITCSLPLNYMYNGFKWPLKTKMYSIADAQNKPVDFSMENERDLVTFTISNHARPIEHATYVLRYRVEGPLVAHDDPKNAILYWRGNAQWPVAIEHCTLSLHFPSGSKLTGEACHIEGTPNHLAIQRANATLTCTATEIPAGKSVLVSATLAGESMKPQNIVAHADTVAKGVPRNGSQGTTTNYALVCIAGIGLIGLVLWGCARLCTTCTCMCGSNCHCSCNCGTNCNCVGRHSTLERFNCGPRNSSIFVLDDDDDW